MRDRVMIIIASPHAITNATASACDFSAWRSRTSFRSSRLMPRHVQVEQGSSSYSPRERTRRSPLLVLAGRDNTTVRQREDPVRHIGEDRIVSYDDCERAELAIYLFDRLENRDSGPNIEGPRWLIAKEN